MGLTGVVPPPPGVTPDFDYSHPWLYTTNMVLIGVGLALSTGFLLLRIYTRARILHKFGPDDGATDSAYRLIESNF